MDLYVYVYYFLAFSDIQTALNKLIQKITLRRFKSFYLFKRCSVFHLQSIFLIPFCIVEILILNK